MIRTLTNVWQVQKDPRGLNPRRLLADVNIYFWFDQGAANIITVTDQTPTKENVKNAMLNKSS